ncbi:MAG: helix-turn-helix domain-containing protein [Chloroflexi bacterium]|nr:helix-turn-helix domain-containing protein [Chloroflexota bacterium]MDA1220159.1 helix-turn-helix domain-containing protein [Chloroflexota bacterium]
MERVSILEASRILNLSQASVRQHIRDGKLKAHRESGQQGNSWMVELPEDGWVDSQKESFIQMAQQMSPWWWPNAARTGLVHYVADVGIEETVPVFLCGLIGENIWDASNHTEEQRCAECLRIVLERELPLSASQ